MEVILLDRVDNLGKLGDKVRVRPGYARNYLLPRGKAVRATAENLASFEARRAELERHVAEELSAAQARAEKFHELVLTIAARSGEQGKLFGSIGPVDIVDAAEARGLEVERSEVRMPEGPIRATGEHTITIHFHTDVNVEVKVIVVGEGEVAREATEGVDADDE